MTCPDCGYMMTAFDKDCPRCERIGKPQKSCLKCGTASSVREIVCAKCSHRFGDPVEPLPTPQSTNEDLMPGTFLVGMNREDIKGIVQEVVASQALSFQHQEQATPRDFMPIPHPGRIVMMWLLSMIAWAFFLSGGAGFGFLLDIIACVIAITLCASRASTDRGNGWVKLIFEGIAFFVAFVNATGHSQS